MMLKFCFPERDPDNIEGETGEEIDENSRGKKTRTSVKKHSKDTNFYVSMPPKDDVDKMKVKQLFLVFVITNTDFILLNRSVQKRISSLFTSKFLKFLLE